MAERKAGKSQSGRRRGLAQLAKSSEQIVPVPLNAAVTPGSKTAAKTTGRFAYDGLDRTELRRDLNETR